MKLYPGLTKTQSYEVKDDDVAAFKGQIVHRVCSTFVLAREVEWATRQFIIDILTPGVEGIGTRLNIDHKGPAFPGEVITIECVVDSFHDGELLCSFTAHVAGRPVAKGQTGQRLVDKLKLAERFAHLRNASKN